MGIPSAIELTETVVGEVPERELPLMLEMVQDTFGEAGRLENTLGAGFLWRSDQENMWAMSETGRNSRVQVTPRNGATKITVAESQTHMLGVLVGVGAIPIGIVIVAVQDGAQYSTLLPALGIIVGAVVFWWRAHWRKRKRTLMGLMQRLMRHVTTTNA